MVGPNPPASFIIATQNPGREQEEAYQKPGLYELQKPGPYGTRFFDFLGSIALALAVEAVAAIYRTVSAGLEGNLGGDAAAVAYHFVHLTLATVTTAAGRAALGTAAGATARLVLEALLGVELLLGSGEHEFGATLAASQYLVFIHGMVPPR